MSIVHSCNWFWVHFAQTLTYWHPAHPPSVHCPGTAQHYTASPHNHISPNNALRDICKTNQRRVIPDFVITDVESDPKPYFPIVQFILISRPPHTDDVSAGSQRSKKPFNIYAFFKSSLVGVNNWSLRAGVEVVMVESWLRWQWSCDTIGGGWSDGVLHMVCGHCITVPIGLMMLTCSLN